MKRANRLFEQIAERENLRWAFHRALLGKRDRTEVRAFAAGLEQNLWRIGSQLWEGTFPFGRFRQFTIYDPKQRTISAPRFDERVVHHAIMNVCEPEFERWLIPDTFACRVGLGREAALERATAFSRRWPFFLKLDMRRYFDSVSHPVLLEKLRKRFKDDWLLELFGRIIGSYDVGAYKHDARASGSVIPAPHVAQTHSLARRACIHERTGLPIGALTSQHFALGNSFRNMHFRRTDASGD